MRKRNIRKFVISAAILTVALAMSACGKKNLNKEGENTNYPFTWEVKKNGTVLVNLDGSYTPDYSWSVVNPDEDIASVEVKKNEKNGKITYKIVPKAEGSVNLEFIREKEAPVVPEPSTEESSDEGISKEEEIRQEQAKQKEQGSEGVSEQTVEENSEDGSEKESGEESEAASDQDENAEEEEIDLSPEIVPGGVYISGYDENDNLIEGEQQIVGDETPEAAIENAIVPESSEDGLKIPVDRVCIIMMTIDVKPKGKSSKKFESEGTVMGIREKEGLRTGEKDGLSYIIWADDTGDLRILLSGVKDNGENEDWKISKTTTYSGSSEKLLDENGLELEGIETEEPVKDANGEYDVLEVLQDGYYNGCLAFVISPLAEGSGDVQIALPGNNATLKLSLEFKPGTVKVTGCSLE